MVLSTIQCGKAFSWKEINRVGIVPFKGSSVLQASLEVRDLLVVKMSFFVGDSIFFLFFYEMEV